MLSEHYNEVSSCSLFSSLQDNASRVSVDTIQKVLKQMDSSIKNLEMDIKNAARAPSEPDDR